MGLSGTRRGFYGATALLAVAESLVYGGAVFALAGVESATGGWGSGMSFFDVPFLRGQSPVVHLLGYAVPLLLAAFLGLWVGSIFTRWGRTGTYAFVVAAVVLGGGLHALASTAGAWGGIGSWFATEPVPALLIGWPLLITAVLAGATWLALRRAGLIKNEPGACGGWVFTAGTRGTSIHFGLRSRPARTTSRKASHAGELAQLGFGNPGHVPDFVGVGGAVVQRSDEGRDRKSVV